MTEKHDHHKGCSFWSRKENRCTLSENGLFIPLENHIVTYCTTDKYTQCTQYKSEQRTSLPDTENPLINRRKYPRIPLDFKITLYKLSTSGRSSILPDSEAHLIDLSSGGMRINTKDPLFHDTLLNFSFDGLASGKEPPRGMATVKWCIYEKDTMNYSAGLAFHNRSTVNSIESSFDLPFH